ncbi:MAG: cupin domain-containing protein [Thermodesulfovibrio sp.]|nr:cupin domain-containing protein [Thermodesulfovibrio sp.]MCX7723907.1 cupin domain-containing protein [Thermodesulfovibrio sp.]MDW7971949.1 cupin domain-containing protein [Thermodesulfovibrio sp.]
MEKIEKQGKFFCEIKFNEKLQKSKIIRFKNNKWQGLKSIPYKDTKGNWAFIERIPIFLSENANFEVRYFEIAPGGKSSLEYHNHIHLVICIKGKGKLRLGKSYRTIKYLDIVYIAPNEVHQLLNPFKEPFGFFCIVDRQRDRPIEIED